MAKSKTKKAVKVHWKHGFRGKVKPEVFYAEFERIKAKNAGQEPTPLVVIDEASDPSHPLHNLFTWDDAACGVQIRVMEFQRHARCLVIKSADPLFPEKPVYINILPEGREWREYVPLSEVQDDADLLAVADEEASVQIEGWIKRGIIINPLSRKCIEAGIAFMRKKDKEAVQILRHILMDNVAA